MVEQQPSKLMTRVRFPSPAPDPASTTTPSQASIGVISFNRPRYLALVLDSLLAQTALGQRQIILFQDNGLSPLSKTRYASDEKIAECIELFRARFPNGKIRLAPHNLGVARNILRAEQFFFSEQDGEIAYFLEDDMVLSAHYLAMMDRLAGYAAQTERVGYFAAYGNLTLPLAQQRLHATSVGRLSYHWAFGMTRKHWVELRAWLEPYYRLSEERDYQQLPVRDIAAHYRRLGLPLVGVTQDVMKKMGTYARDRVAINTVAVFGRNIGQTGVHFDPQKFRHDGFGETELYPQPVELNFPRADELDMLHAEEMAACWSQYNERLARRDLQRNSRRAPPLQRLLSRLLHLH
jgi:glycosyltransferase involved in cell wall biosynthesis